MSKKISFQTSKSPIQIDVNTTNPNVLEDWKRLKLDKVFIDGKSLKDHFDEGEIDVENLELETLKNFFLSVILKKMPENQRENAINYLMEAFHQGGLLHPVSGATYKLFGEQAIGPVGSTSEKKINICTHYSGFTIQEIYTVEKFSLTINSPKELSDKYPDLLVPPDGNNLFCLKAQATIDVDLSGDTGKFEVKSSSMSYGNDMVKNIADKREWYVKFMDYLKNLFGLNKVEDLSEPAASQSTLTHK